MSSTKGNRKNRPCHKLYLSENRRRTNKMRRIVKSYGRNTAAGRAAAEEWRRQYGKS